MFRLAYQFGMLCVFAIVAAPVDAAASGTVTGTFVHVEANQGYCPDSRGAACNGVWYRETKYRNNSNKPALSNVLVKLYDNANNFRGEDYTNSSGYFEISWSGSAFPAYLVFEFQSPRFRIESTNGVLWSNTTAAFGINNGAFPTGTWHVGTATTPNDISNIYSAANRQFEFALDYVAELVNDAGANKAKIQYPASCPSGCYGFGTHVIGIPNDATDESGGGPLAGPTRTAHELGHWATDHVSPNNGGSPCLFYDFPSNSTGGTWNMESSEYGCSAYSEGFAMFISDVSRYWSSYSAAADTCHSDAYPECNLMLETSLGTACQLANPCPNDGPARREALQVTRFLWDSYDTAVDGICGSQPTNQSYSKLVMNHANFGANSSNRGLTEHTSTTHRDEGPGSDSDDDGFNDGAGASDIDEVRGESTSVSNNRRDQSGIFDYWWNYFSANGVALEPHYKNNCAPPGN